MNIFDEMDKAISEFFAAADDFIKNEKDTSLLIVLVNSTFKDLAAILRKYEIF